jgi:hypothetical protein
MALAIPQQFVRRAGSGFTIFTFGGQPISFCQQVAHTSPQPVGQGVSAIQPMDEPAPIELITPAAAGMGQIVLNLFELFGSNGKASKVWDRLGVGVNQASAPPFGNFTGGDYTGDASNLMTGNLGSTSSGLFHGAVDIVDIFIAQAKATPQQMSVVQIIRPPQLPTGSLFATIAGNQTAPYYISYQGCVITNVQDGEQVDVGSLEIIKQLTIAYRYSMRDGLASQGFKQRDAMLGTGGMVGQPGSTQQ